MYLSNDICKEIHLDPAHEPILGKEETFGDIPAYRAAVIFTLKASDTLNAAANSLREKSGYDMNEEVRNVFLIGVREQTGGKTDQYITAVSSVVKNGKTTEVPEKPVRLILSLHPTAQEGIYGILEKEVITMFHTTVNNLLNKARLRLQNEVAAGTAPVNKQEYTEKYTLMTQKYSGEIETLEILARKDMKFDIRTALSNAVHEWNQMCESRERVYSMIDLSKRTRVLPDWLTSRHGFLIVDKEFGITYLKMSESI